MIKLSSAVQAKQKRIFDAMHIRQTQRDAAGRKMAEDMRDWSHWYLLAVRSGREERVADELEKAGIWVWMPKMVEHRRCVSRGKRRKCERIETRVIIFRGFVLVRIVPSAHAWHGLMSFDNVLGLAAPNCESWDGMSVDQRRLGYLRMSFIELVRMMESAEFVNLSTGKWKFKPGDRVRIKDGPFAGLLGVVSKKRAIEQMIWVEVNCFGQEVPTILEVDQLEKSD